MLTIGCHLSASKGFYHMGKTALSIGANTFQFFTRNPRGSKAKDIDEKDVAKFLQLSAENGITITGGCGQIWGMDLLLMERTGIACILADDPDSCTAYGAGKSLAWINNMQEGPINIARKRAMKSGF